MKSFTSRSLIALIAIILSSCAQIYYTPDAYTLAHSQKTIAIIPPKVSITSRKSFDTKSMKEQEKKESINIQREMYSWMLKRKMQGRISQEIQDIETTNALLKKAGFPEKGFTFTQLSEVLGVDGLMTSSFGLSKPMSDGAAVAVALLVGVMAPTNEVQVSLSIRDCETKKTIWNYDHIYSGSIGSSPSRLVDGLMRNASKKMPYLN